MVTHVEKYPEQGYEGRAFWEKIIERSTVANEAGNKKFGIQ